MKLFSTLALLLLFHAQSFAAEPKKLAVHEWGIFRVHEDEAMANADMRAIWDGLPPFIYGHIRGRIVPQHWGAVELRNRPVIYFHATEPTQLKVKLEFPGGMAAVWWPGTSSPALYGNQKQPPVGKTLEWELAVKKHPGDWRPKTPQPPEIEKGHWCERLREVKSDEIFTRFGPGGHYVEREKFIYYDGLFPQRKWLKIDVRKENVVLTNRVNHPVFDITVVDRRSDDKIRVGRIEKLPAGEKTGKIAFVDVDASRFPSEASDLLVKQLSAAGLNEDEAKSLVDLSRKEFFETPGLHVYYRIPQDEYDRLLPLTLTPKPPEVIRVGLIFHAHVEPDLAERVLELVKQLDAPRFAVRDAAKKKLLQIGPAALVQLGKLKPKDLSTEVWKEVEMLIKQWNAKGAFE